MISEHPPKLRTRAVPGHWEGPRRGPAQLRYRDPGRTHHQVHDGVPTAPHGRTRWLTKSTTVLRWRATALRPSATPSHPRSRTLPKQFVGRLPRYQGARMTQHAPDCASTRGWRSTSATLTAHGSAPRTRTPTACPAILPQVRTRSCLPTHRLAGRAVEAVAGTASNSRPTQDSWIRKQSRPQTLDNPSFVSSSVTSIGKFFSVRRHELDSSPSRDRNDWSSHICARSLPTIVLLPPHGTSTTIRSILPSAAEPTVC